MNKIDEKVNEYVDRDLVGKKQNVDLEELLYFIGSLKGGDINKREEKLLGYGGVIYREDIVKAIKKKFKLK